MAGLGSIKTQYKEGHIPWSSGKKFGPISEERRQKLSLIFKGVNNNPKTGVFLPKELVGNIYGKWKVLELYDRLKNGIYRWTCKCDCGTIKIVRQTSLLNGASKSCGCYNAEIARKDKKFTPLTAYRGRVMTIYKKSAKNRNVEFKLTLDELSSIIDQSCYYCGEPPANTVKIRGVESRYNGIDRVDNNLGYTMENIVPCCSNCNRAKLQMSKGDFLNLIEKIYLKHFIKCQ